MTLSVFVRISRWLTTLAGATLASAAPLAAQTVSPSTAPAEWVRYAERATATITAWLEADAAPAMRLRAYLDATRPAEDRATPALQLKVWVAADGMVSRIDFPPFAHEEPNADLRTLIVGRRLAAAPPRDMLLPLRLAIQLDAPPSPPPPPSGGGDRT